MGLKPLGDPGRRHPHYGAFIEKMQDSREMRRTLEKRQGRERLARSVRARRFQPGQGIRGRGGFEVVGDLSVLSSQLRTTDAISPGSRGLTTKKKSGVLSRRKKPAPGSWAARREERL